MAYQALYRKYRLSSFDDMVGQDHISSTIKNAISLGKISHAYLFSGPRGTGKTSIAKLIARAVNCSGEEVLCGKCEACQSILNSEISDIIEIDAASNNGVDEIRDIRDKVKYAPTSCKYKVYIIDETHMLTTQAFNALLKTLEEPPSHVIFILATTEPHKIPLTILSRCQRFDFRKISEDAIVERLLFVIENENIMISEDAIKLIAYLSDGGMRDALSLLDQVSSYISGEITAQDVYNVTGTASKDAVERVLRYVLSKNKAELLNQISLLNKQGKDIVKLCDSLVVYLRDAMVSVNGVSENLIYSDSPVFETITTLSIEELYKYIQILTDVLYKLKMVHNPKIYLEVSLLNLIEQVNKELEFADEIVSYDTSALFTEVTHEEEKKNEEIVLELEEEIDDFEEISLLDEEEVSEEDQYEKYQEEILTADEKQEETLELFGEEEEEVEELTNEIEEEVEEVVESEQIEEAINISPIENVNDIDAFQSLDDSAFPEGYFEDQEMVEDAVYMDEETVNLEDSVVDVNEVIQEVAENINEEVEDEQEITEEMHKKYYNYLRGVRINNTLYDAKKGYLVEYQERWLNIHSYDDIEHSHLVSILKSAHLRASNERGIIISVPTEMMVVKLMSELDAVERIVGTVVRNYIKLAIVSEGEWVRIREDYIAKLKTGADYTLMEEQTFNQYFNLADKRDVLIEKAKEYFGMDRLEVEE